MGNYCCAETEDLNPISKKLIRATFVNTINDKGKKIQQGVIRIYDIESCFSDSIQIKLSFFKNLDTVSQISFGNVLYLCGDQGSFDTGSSLISYDLLSPIKNVSILPNSIFPHFKPSLCFVKKDFLIVVGGKGTTKCEIFNKNSCKWRKLPDLPEERYGSCIINDDKLDCLLLFGGKLSNNYCKSILKLNLKKDNFWDKVILREESNLLERTFFTVAKPSSSESFFIFGGNANEKASNEIIEFDYFNKKLINSFTLERPCCFDVNSIAEHNNNLFFIDDCDSVHKISRREGKSEIIFPFESDNFERVSYYGGFNQNNQNYDLSKVTLPKITEENVIIEETA